MLKRSSLCCLCLHVRFCRCFDRGSNSIFMNIQLIKYRSNQKEDYSSFITYISIKICFWIYLQWPNWCTQYNIGWWSWATYSSEQCYQGVPGVVEKAAVPHFVLPSGWRVEETWVWAVKAVQAILGVLGGVAVNDIQQHHDAHWMRHIN